jgi:cytoskeletal protein RodZ
MSALEKRMASRRNDAQQAQRRKKLVLIGLMVVFAALLAFQLPKLLKGSGSSSGTASTSSTTSAVPSTSVAGTRSLTAAKTSVSVRRARAIHGLAPKDLFVPLIHDGTSTSSPESSAPAAPATSAPTQAAQPAASAAPAVTKPAHVKPAVPNAAVIWTNGHRQVVGVSQVFSVGDAQFRLVSVTRDAIRIQAVGGAFSGRGPVTRVQKGHRVNLTNMATGVQYSLLFTQAGLAASSGAQQPPALSAN